MSIQIGIFTQLYFLIDVHLFSLVFDNVIVIFKKIIENFFNIIRLREYQSINRPCNFIHSMTYTIPNSFMSNLLGKIFLIYLII